MIRFCDRDICCVMENEMDWQLLADYLVDKPFNEKVYVIDDAGKYIGSTNYNALFGVIPKYALHKEEMFLDGNRCIWIVKDSLVLDEFIWENGRKYFAADPYVLMPVIDKEQRLVCFAWNEIEADRELRMLDELMSCSDVLGFKDVHPQAECVIVRGCNELAYFFVRYLEKEGVPVNVAGEFWDVFGSWVKTEAPDYRNFVIYGEGCESLKEEKGELRKSVSVEFECIDWIYEKNIINGLIRDAYGSFQDLLERIKERNIVIIGADTNALRVYDLLLGYGLDISCFISENSVELGKDLFRKRALERTEAIKKIENPVFLQIDSKHSAWGFGGTDFYHYIGYKRNENFFLLKDYIDVPPMAFLIF